MMAWDYEDKDGVFDVLDLAQDLIGSEALAAAIGVRPCAISAWKRRGEVPVAHVPRLIAALAGVRLVTASMLCPVGKDLARHHDAFLSRAAGIRAPRPA